MKLSKKFLSHLSPESPESLLSRYQVGLETSMKVSDFFFDGVSSLYYKCHNNSFKCSGSCIESPDWVKKYQQQIQKNKNNKCFQYVACLY